MAANGRGKERRQLDPAFEGQADADPGEEEQGAPTALAMAIAEAAQAAAAYLDDNNLPATQFEVTRIEVTVSPNPGPTSYRAVITPTG